MYRSASSNRVIGGDDPYNSYYNSSSASTSKFPPSLRALSLETNESLPIYNSVNSETFRKEKSRAKLAENAVHLIPVVLIICALILWFGSNPVTDRMQGKDNSGGAAANIEGLSLESDVDSSGAVLPVHSGYLKPVGVQDGTDAEAINNLHDGLTLH